MNVTETSTENLKRIVTVLNAKVLRAMAAGEVMTTAHVRWIERANDCTDELVRRRFALSPAVVYYMDQARLFARKAARLTEITLSPGVEARDLLRRRGALCLQMAKLCRARDLTAA